MSFARLTMPGALLGLVAVLTGCGVGGSLHEDTVSYDVTGKVAALHVEADSGSVQVVGSDRRDIRVTERLSWHNDKPATSHEVRADTLELAFTCPTTWGWGAVGTTCDVSYQVEVPEHLSVKVTSDSGDLTLKTLSGSLAATSDSGAIRTIGLTGKQVTTKTDSGDMTLTFTGQPDKVTTVTDSGQTVIHVPQGPYNIVAKTDSGTKDIKAAGDSSAKRSIELSSDSGDLQVVTP
jgi:DUF4097 and DUF4098 domain-containing protein YvlB